MPRRYKVRATLLADNTPARKAWRKKINLGWKMHLYQMQRHREKAGATGETRTPKAAGSEPVSCTIPNKATVAA